MSKFKTIYFKIVGDVEKIGTERYFVSTTTFIASIFLFALSLVHYAMNLKIMPIFIAGCGAALMLVLYYFVRFRNCLFYPKLIISVLGLILLDFTWYSKFLSHGPVLFFIMIFGALIMWVWSGKSLSFFLIFYFLNLLALFLIDTNTPENLFTYTIPGRRTVDIYFSFGLYSVLLIYLLSVVKKEFKRQTDKAIQSEALKSAFLANMSHEIRTPLNSIVGFSQLLKEATDEKVRNQYHNFIWNSSDQLLSLVNDIIDLSRMEAGDLEIKYSNFKIRELFLELRDSFQLVLSRNDEKSRIQLGYSVEPYDLIVNSDYNRLKQVLVNLIRNAIKFTREGSITYSCILQDHKVMFIVSDTGTGIPEEHKEKIFDRFNKYNYMGMNTEGSGIGLSIVESILKALNGKIWVESEVGKGSKFYFTTPHNHLDAGSKEIARPDGGKLNSGFSNRRSVLVVEDDKPSYQLIREGIKSLNVDIHHVSDGQDAIDFVKFNPDIDLILMDLKLPNLDGYEATREIKKSNPGIPVIGQSAYAMSGDKEKAISAGCDNYITKPLDLAKLQSMIRSYLAE